MWNIGIDRHGFQRPANILVRDAGILICIARLYSSLVLFFPTSHTHGDVRRDLSIWQLDAGQVRTAPDNDLLLSRCSPGRDAPVSNRYIALAGGSEGGEAW